MTAPGPALTAEDLATISGIRWALKNGKGRGARWRSHARRRREAINVRLGEFAAALGKAESTVSQWERRVREPGAQDALAYARLLAALELAAGQGEKAA